MHKPQSYANHRSLPPPLILVAGVVLFAEACLRLWLAVREPSFDSVWAVLVALALLGVWYWVRRRAQVVQDRVIRLEMRLRLERLLGAARRSDVEHLKLSQVIALRFASDAELPALFERVLAGQLVLPKEIKLAVRDWQADWLRV